MPQPVVTHRAVALDVGILLRISELDIYQTNTVLFRPKNEFAADVFRAVVAANSPWLKL